MPKTSKNNVVGNGGYTLVEMLVSLAIFSMAMTVAAQLFFYSLKAKNMLVAHSQLINEMTYNFEHISRGLRMAKKSTDATCLSASGLNFEKTATGIKFQNPGLAGGVECVEYYIGNPYPSGVNALMERRVASAWNFDLPLTSPEINVVSFSVAESPVFSGWSQEDDLQPRVTLYMKAENDQGEVIENQITVSQRDIDVRE